uniref:Semaphorin-2A n=1 Tax=Ditylenchus dipsaci TaxID=166011 RepID=A0A915EJA6_9BILA
MKGSNHICIGVDCSFSSQTEQSGKSSSVNNLLLPAGVNILPNVPKMAELIDSLLATPHSGYFPQIKPDNIFHVAGETNLGYSQLLVDPKSTSLYVGARGHVFRLWLYNINDTASANLFSSRSLATRPEDKEECLRMGNSDRECTHSVRQLFLKSNGQVLMCSSNAMKPQMSTLDGQSLALNTTAVYTEFGNPDELPSIYSGIRTGLSLENHLIYRPPLVFNNKEQHPALRTIYTDSKWLNEPQFVGSFAINQQRVVYSRVARICKSDLGGKSVLRQVWSSFLKARLNCSVSSPSAPSLPFYFDHIQSVFKLDQESDTHFYATFTTPESPFFQASAVCAFSLNAINQVFDTGIFLEQSIGTSSSPSATIWLPTPLDRVPSNRPGMCVSDSKSLSDEELHFAKSHLLMADSIAGSGGIHDGPLIHRKEELLGQLVADQRDEQRVVLFVLSPHTQTLLKVLHLRERGIVGRARIIAIYHLSQAASNPIHSMAILPNEYLFLGQEHNVAQYRLGQCLQHSTCDLCASDPYCSWNIARAECFPQETAHSTAVGWVTLDGLVHSPTGLTNEKCRNYVKSTSRTIYPGDSSHLDCPLVGGVNDGLESEWKLDRMVLPKQDTEHVVYARDGGIVLLNVTNAQSGTYQCWMAGSPLIEHTVRVDGEDCARPRSVEQFRSVQREWCRKMDSYKSNLSKWQGLYDSNESHCPGVEQTTTNEIDNGTGQRQTSKPNFV